MTETSIQPNLGPANPAGPPSPPGPPPHSVHPAVFPVALLALGGLGLLYLSGHNPHDAGVPMLKCPINLLTGLDCPSCGSTRMTYDLLHGNWLQAWRDNAVLLMVSPVALGLYGKWLWEGLRGRSWKLRLKPWVVATVLSIAAAWFVVRNFVI